MKKLVLLGVSAVAMVLASGSAFANQSANTKGKETATNPTLKPIEAKSTAKKDRSLSAREMSRGGLGLEISGVATSNFYAFKNSQREENGGKGRGTHIGVDDTRLNFEVSGFADKVFNGVESDFNELYYSFLFGMNFSGEPESNPVEEARIKLKGRWGTFMFGQHRGPTDFMAAGPFTFVGGTGGVTGNYKAITNETTGSVIRDDLGNRLTPKDANKVTYVTPRVEGFALGYAFIPDSTAKGSPKLTSHTDKGKDYKAQTIHEAALSYKNTFAGVGVNMALTGMRGHMKASRTTNDPRHDFKAFSVGAVFDYAGFSLGGEYLNNFKSGELKKLQGVNAGKVYTLGLGYKFGANAVSLSHFNSRRSMGTFSGENFGHVKTKNYAVTYDRDLVTGLGFYVEGITANMKASASKAQLNTWNKTINKKAADTVDSNRTKAVITGVKMKF